MVLTKALESAFAAMSLLAERYDDGKTTLTADEIAGARGLPRPFVAKLLTSLSQHRLVIGKRGPKGGFYLARSPEQISLFDVAESIGFNVGVRCCMFGPEWGEGNRCPLHEQVVGLRDGVCGFLSNNTLAGFAKSSHQSESVKA